MKQLVLIFMSLLTFSCPSKAQKQTADTDRPSDKKILVAYFSCTGTTEKVATAIAKETGGKLYRITPATAYTSSDLDWNDKASRSSVEMTDEKSRPALGGETIDLKDYDVVFLGYPLWWDLCPRPVNTFLEKYDFAGKTVIPFATSGGSSITGSVKQLKKLYPKIEWEENDRYGKFRILYSDPFDFRERARHHHTEMDATYPQRPHAGTFCEVQCGYLRFAPLTEKDIYEILEASL